MVGGGYALLEEDYKVFDFIESFWDKKGYSPSVREIATGVSIHLSRVLSALRKLRRSGFIDYQDGKVRTIRVVRYNLTRKGR